MTVNEADLATVTDAELKKSGIDMTREELLEAFAQGVKLMQEAGIQPRDRVRPVADQQPDGNWTVGLVCYSARTDPLMRDPPKGRG